MKELTLGLLLMFSMYPQVSHWYGECCEKGTRLEIMSSSFHSAMNQLQGLGQITQPLVSCKNRNFILALLSSKDVQPSDLFFPYSIVYILMCGLNLLDRTSYPVIELSYKTKSCGPTINFSSKNMKQQRAFAYQKRLLCIQVERTWGISLVGSVIVKAYFSKCFRKNKRLQFQDVSLEWSQGGCGFCNSASLQTYGLKIVHRLAFQFFFLSFCSPVKHGCFCLSEHPRMQALQPLKAKERDREIFQLMI